MRPESKAEASADRKRHVWFVPAILGLLLCSGVAAIFALVHRADTKLRTDLLTQARLVVEAVSIDRVRSLSGTEADLDSPQYRQLKNQLARVKSAHDRCRFVYLTARRPDGAVFFLVDSEPIGSENESPAGQVYEEISPEFAQAFDTRCDLTEGPITDRWGTWVSAIVPLIDHRSGELVAMLGMDIDARTWRADVALAAALPATLLLVLMITLGAGFVAARTRGCTSVRHVRRRLLVPMAALLLLLLSGFEAVFLDMHQRNLDEASSDKLTAASRHMSGELQAQTRTLAALEDVILDNPDIARLLGSLNRAELLEKYTAVFLRLKAEHGITHFYFHRPDRKVLLRVHQPSRHGDIIDRFTLRESQRTQGQSAGIELGPLGTFTLRVVRPVFDGDEIVGYLELGKEIEDVLAGIRTEHRVEVAVAIHKCLLKRDGWEAGMHMLGREADWDRFEDNVLIYASLRSFPPEWDRFLAEKGHEHGTLSGDSDFNGKAWHVLNLPLKDVSDNEVGDLLIFQDVSEAKAEFNRLFALTTEAAMVVLVLLLAILYVALNRVDKSILAREEGLKASERFQRTLIETSPDFIGVLDKDMNVRTMNRPAQGHTEEDIIGKGILTYTKPEHHERFIRTFNEVLETLELRTVETTAVLPDGEHFFLNRLNPLPGGDEERAVVVFGIDITDRKRAEEKLRESNNMLEEQTARANHMAVKAEMASAAKSEFLANMSHEIRTPMTAILGFAEIAMECVADSDAAHHAEQRDHLRTILVNGEYLLGLINNILDLSKIEAGKMVVEQIECSPAQIAAEVESLMRVRSKSKGLDLIVEYEGPIPETIRSDPTRLRQILINLMGNAIKFTEVGRVSLVIRTVEDADGKGLMEFEVVDTGLGMTQAQANRLFKPFTQGDASTTRDFGGTGLGLAISKRLAEALGGDVQIVESRKGVGSRFRLSIATGPLDGVRMIDGSDRARVLDEAKSSQSAQAESLNCRILLAEDGPDNQRLVAHILRKAGAEVDVVENGQLAVEAARGAEDAGNPFDVILMDMQMPVMDGYAATSTLRRKGYKGAIIALTAHAMMSDRQKCLDAGCDDYASKPIDRRVLLATIESTLSEADAQNASLQDVNT